MADLLLSLIAFAIVVTFTPGGAPALATASGVQFGFQRSIPLLAGITVGLASLVVSVAGGLGALLQTFPNFKLGVQLVGTAYLLWLAWSIGRSGRPGATTNSPAAPMKFWTGLLLLWLNPKAWTAASRDVV